MTSPSVKLLRTQSDDRLVALAAAGHERAFEAIVEPYRRPLLRHCRRYLPEARAEDALPQALVSAWSALRRGDDVRELRPWLHRIVHNTSLNALRAAGYDYEQLHDTLHGGGGGPAELTERSAVVRQTLAGLAGWLAAGRTDGRGDLIARVGELVADAGGGATLAKAGSWPRSRAEPSAGPSRSTASPMSRPRRNGPPRSRRPPARTTKPNRSASGAKRR